MKKDNAKDNVKDAIYNLNHKIDAIPSKEMTDETIYRENLISKQYINEQYRKWKRSCRL